MQHQNLWSKIIFSGLIGGLLMSTSLAHAEEQVLCIPTKNVLVFQSNLKSVVFSGDQFEVVRAFQGWGEVKKTITVKGQRVTYVKTQFVDRQEEDAENDIGWVRESHIKLKSKCAGYTRADNTNDDSVKLSFQSDAGDGITGLNDVDCCRFPLNSSAHANYTTGMRQFGWGRGAGRKRAVAARGVEGARDRGGNTSV